MVVDMGGTSYDASIVKDGEVQITREGEINRHPIALPMIDVQTIGAGGGSIGWLDEGGLLHMGPQSAGADPGPVAYGRGGVEPTCTDADLVLGYLDPELLPRRADEARRRGGARAAIERADRRAARARRRRGRGGGDARGDHAGDGRGDQGHGARGAATTRASC